MYVALLLVSGVVFSACIPGQEEKVVIDDANEVIIKDDSLEGEAVITDDDKGGTEDDEVMKQDAREISMEMGMFYYTPNVIEAKAGETITVVVENVEGLHDFVIDELDVATEQVSGGESVTATFTIPEDASGTEYEFYCSVGNHRAQGMVGTLIVK